MQKSRACAEYQFTARDNTRIEDGVIKVRPSSVKDDRASEFFLSVKGSRKIKKYKK